MMVSRGFLSTVSVCLFAGSPHLCQANDANPTGLEETAETQSTEPISADAFFRNPTISQPKLSPDGRQIAFVFSKDNSQRLFVREVAGTDAVVLAGLRLEQMRLRCFDWVNATQVILSVDAPDPEEVGVQPLVTRIYGVNLERPRLKWLGERWGKRGPDWPTTQARFRDHVVSIFRGDDNYVLLSHVEFGERTPSVSKLNVVTGRLRKVEGPRGGLEAWHVDDEGVIRAAEVLGESSDRKSYTLLARTQPDQKLAPILESPDKDAEGYGFAGFHESSKLLYVFANHEGRRAVFELDIETRQLGKLVFAHEKYDVEALHYDPTRGRYVGAEYLADQPEVGFFDDAAGKRQASIDHALRTSIGRQTTNRIVSATRDGNLSIVEVTSDVQPPVYYALNSERKAMDFVFEQRPDLPLAQLLPVDKIDVPTRDGLTVPGYLTRPRERGKTEPPMIVMLHGGLGARASRVYDPAVQFFASRGYAVLQVNHRGSGGFGRAFERVGASEASVMEVVQNDLADAVTWATEQGIADPARVAIFGVDGGGTIAMLAVATSPRLFRAGASYGGDTGFAEIKGESSGPGPESANEREAAGEPAPKSLPIHRVSEIKTPVLLAHGARNTVVRVEDARALVRALEAAGKSVESVEYAEETTGFVLERNRIDFYERLLGFFERHLGAQVGAAIPPDGDE